MIRSKAFETRRIEVGLAAGPEESDEEKSCLRARAMICSMISSGNEETMASRAVWWWWWWQVQEWQAGSQCEWRLETRAGAFMRCIYIHSSLEYYFGRQQSKSLREMAALEASEQPSVLSVRHPHVPQFHSNQSSTNTISKSKSRDPLSRSDSPSRLPTRPSVRTPGSSPFFSLDTLTPPSLPRRPLRARGLVASSHRPPFSSNTRSAPLSHTQKQPSEKLFN